MARFLIEVTHGPEVDACTRAVEVFLRTGSHFLTRADWGCKDGVHKAWIVVELDSKSDALNLVPPDFRSQATVVQLNTFSLEQIEELRRHHDAGP
ncbi:MAG: hypothetical protein JSW46_00625 [Gemmatimonadota bacterium]|nr:MAG: hypothetical protein JSW46_00625 [Gemmatimonadota bacterium]